MAEEKERKRRRKTGKRKSSTFVKIERPSPGRWGFPPPFKSVISQLARLNTGFFLINWLFFLFIYMARGDN